MKICPKCEICYEDKKIFCEKCGASLTTIHTGNSSNNRNDYKRQYPQYNQNQYTQKNNRQNKSGFYDNDDMDTVYVNRAKNNQSGNENYVNGYGVNNVNPKEINNGYGYNYHKNPSDVNYETKYYEEKPKRKLPSKKVKAILSVCLAAVIAIGVYYFAFFKNEGGKNYPSTLNYARNENIYYNDEDNNEMLLIDNIDNDNKLNVINTYDGSKFIYIEESVDNKISVYFKNKNDKDRAERIDKNISYVSVDKNSGNIYYLKDEVLKLYDADKGEAINIDKNVDRLWVAEDGKRVMYATDESFYIKPIDSGKEKVFDIKNTEYFATTKNIEKVYFNDKDGKIYEKKSGKDAVLIDKNVKIDFIQMVDDKLYYIKIEESIRASSLVNYSLSNDNKNYNEAYDEFKEKNEKINFGKLYCYDDEGKNLISDNFCDRNYVVSNGFIIYTECSIDDLDGSFITVESSDTVQKLKNKIEDLVKKRGTMYISKGKKKAVVDVSADYVLDEYRNYDDNVFIGEVNDDYKYDVYKVSVKEDNFGECTLYDKDVDYMFDADSKGRLVYLKNKEEKNDDLIADIYIGKDKIASNLVLYNWNLYIYYSEKTDTYAFIGNEGKSGRALKTYKNGKIVKIADDIGDNDFEMELNGDIFYLAQKEGKKNLFLYNGKKSRDYDTEVEYIYQNDECLMGRHHNCIEIYKADE